VQTPVVIVVPMEKSALSMYVLVTSVCAWENCAKMAKGIAINLRNFLFMLLGIKLVKFINMYIVAISHQPSRLLFVALRMAWLEWLPAHLRKRDNTPSHQSTHEQWPFRPFQRLQKYEFKGYVNIS